jgi:ketosteroid isomerase-like protein
MSQENVDFVRSVFGGIESTDKDALLAALPDLIAQLTDPEIEWIEDPTRADSRTYRGHEGVLESWARWFEQWDEYGWEAERFIDCGDDNVFVAARETGSGAASGATVSAAIFIVITLRDQKVVRWREYYDEATALKAVGLQE